MESIKTRALFPFSHTIITERERDMHIEREHATVYFKNKILL